MKPEDTKSPEYWEKHAPGLTNTGTTMESVLDEYQAKFGYPCETISAEGGDKAEEGMFVKEEH